MELKIIESVICPQEDDLIRIEHCRRCGYFQSLTRLSNGFSRPDWAAVCGYVKEGVKEEKLAQ